MQWNITPDKRNALSGLKDMKNFTYILPSDRNQSEKLSSGKYTTVETVKISIIARDLALRRRMHRWSIGDFLGQ